MTSERSNDASSNARRPSSSIRQRAKLVGASVIALHLVIGYLVGAAQVMACPLHISFPGTLYRVASRGNARQKIFRDDEGRKTFLEWVESDIAILTICGAGMCKNGAFSLFLLHAAVD